MKHVYVGDCPVCGAQRELKISHDGYWKPTGEDRPPEWVTLYTVLKARCPKHPEEPGRSWKFEAGEEWQLTLKVEEDDYADPGEGGVPQGEGTGRA